MTGLEKILKQIHDEAQQKADEVIAQAKTEAAQIVENAKAEAKIQCGYIDEQSETAVQNYIASTKSAADLARRRAIHTAKQEIIGAANADAQQSILPPRLGAPARRLCGKPGQGDFGRKAHHFQRDPRH